MDQTKKIIYIFGNPLLDFDNVPIKILEQLQKEFPNINFIIQDPNENLHPAGGELIIIDTVTGPPDVVVINDIDKIERTDSCSMHDLDLAFNLKLLQKIGELKKLTIFGVPMGMGEDEVLKKLVQLIKKYSIRN